MACGASGKETEGRKESLEKLATYLEESLGIQRDLAREHATACKGFLCFSCGRHKSSFITWVYIVIKFLYLGNVVGQFFLLNEFLGTNYTFWGAQIFSDLVRGVEWHDSGHFPRVTMCDFKIRKLGNIHRHTVQCVLMINLFNEKIYLFLWFWFFFVAVCSSLNCLYWIYTSFMPQKREQLVHKYLRVAADVQDALTDRYAVRRFTLNTLRSDGVLLLRFISGHAGDMIALELTGTLWKDYLNRIATLPKPPDSPKSKASVDAIPEKMDPGMIETLYSVDHGGNGAAGDGRGIRSPLLPSAPTTRQNGELKTGYPGPPMAQPS